MTNLSSLSKTSLSLWAALVTGLGYIGFMAYSFGSLALVGM